MGIIHVDADMPTMTFVITQKCVFVHFCKQNGYYTNLDLMGVEEPQSLRASTGRERGVRNGGREGGKEGGGEEGREGGREGGRGGGREGGTKGRGYTRVNA